jgi:hypothetical protein
VFTSVSDLKRKLMRYIRQYNKAPRTVKWKYACPNRTISTESVITGHQEVDPYMARVVTQEVAHGSVATVSSYPVFAAVITLELLMALAAGATARAVSFCDPFNSTVRAIRALSRINLARQGRCLIAASVSTK